MIILDRNSYDLLSYVIKLDKPETVMAISRVLGQSRRKVYYHLDKINEALPAKVPKIISYPRVGILLSDSQKEACRDLLADLDDYSYVMSVAERMLLSVLYIAISDKRVTIEKLMKLNDVSRNTILNDLNDIRQSLDEEPLNITLQVTKSRGYYLECHPLTKIQFLNKLLHDTYRNHTTNFVLLIRSKLAQFADTSLYFSEALLDFLTQQLQSSQKILGKKINPKDIQLMAETLPYHLLGYRNLHLSETEKMDLRREFYLIRQRKEFELAQDIVAKLEKKFTLVLDDIETSLMTVLLLSYRKDKDSHLESHDYDEMRKTIKTFVSYLETTYQIRFKHRQSLLNQLLTHCKALIFRKTFGILANNPLTEQIKEKYAAIFNMMKSSVGILEEAWYIKMNDDDIAYLAVHIGGELRHNEGKPTAPAKLVLVSDDGIGMQKLLIQQCQKYLPHSNIEAVLTTEQFLSVRDILDANLILSTNDHLETDFPALFVHSILTDDDIIKLIRFAKQHSQSGHDDFTQKLEHFIHQYVKDEKDCYVLKNKIERLINEELLYDRELGVDDGAAG